MATFKHLKNYYNCKVMYFAICHIPIQLILANLADISILMCFFLLMVHCVLTLNTWPQSLIQFKNAHLSNFHFRYPKSIFHRGGHSKPHLRHQRTEWKYKRPRHICTFVTYYAKSSLRCRRRRLSKSKQSYPNEWSRYEYTY